MEKFLIIIGCFSFTALLVGLFMYAALRLILAWYEPEEGSNDALRYS